jgi:hypothetical protein
LTVAGASGRIALVSNPTTGFSYGRGLWANKTTQGGGGGYFVTLDEDASATFYGALSGNASTATTWETARTLTIGETGKSVNGGANVSWSKNEILGESTNAYFLRGDKEWSNTLNGTFTANGTITANGGYLKSTLNNNTL